MVYLVLGCVGAGLAGCTLHDEFPTGLYCAGYKCPPGQECYPDNICRPLGWTADASVPDAPPVPPDAAWDYCYIEEFNDGTAEGWIEVNGTWTVGDYDYRLNDSDGLAYYAAETFSDGDISVLAASLSTDPDQKLLGMLYRYTETQGGYAFMFDPGGSGFFLMNLEGNVVTPIVGAQASSSGPMRVLRAFVTGTTHRLFLDDELVLEHDDATYATGHVGFFATGGAASFNSVMIRCAP